MATKVVSRSVATAMAISSRASRACDVCASKSAHWYCGADAAYLCDRCDTQVHSANSLAQRHERVRLTPAGVPMKGKKRSPPVLQPARKRTRSSRPHPHRRPAAAVVEAEVAVKVESTSECNLFADFFDADFLSSSDDTHEVPSFASSSPSTSSGSEASLELPGDSLAAYFKGKAAHDEFLVPDGFDSGIDTICCDADGNISLAGEACFVPGDIPGLDAFDDCSLGFNLAQRGLSPDAFLTSTATPGDEFSNGPFAKYFVKRKAASEATPSPEVAKEILRCCEAEPRPALRLNYEEIITAWSNRGEPWVNPGDSTTEADEGRREARVLRYKEKKRTRLFSKTIRYQVRQQNAECRPRLKGRFVKRTE